MLWVENFPTMSGVLVAVTTAFETDPAVRRHKVSGLEYLLRRVFSVFRKRSEYLLDRKCRDQKQGMKMLLLSPDRLSWLSSNYLGQDIWRSFWGLRRNVDLEKRLWPPIQGKLNSAWSKTRLEFSMRNYLSNVSVIFNSWSSLVTLEWEKAAFCSDSLMTASGIATYLR